MHQTAFTCVCSSRSAMQCDGTKASPARWLGDVARHMCPIAPATHFELADTEWPGIVGGPTILRGIGLKPKVLGTTRLQLRKVHLQEAPTHSVQETSIVRLLCCLRPWSTADCLKTCNLPVRVWCVWHAEAILQEPPPAIAVCCLVLWPLQTCHVL